MVRSVKLSYRASMPDLVEYAICLRQRLGLTIWPSRPAPRCPLMHGCRRQSAPTLLANLTGLSVTALNGSTVTVNAGATPPAGGGFEVRRRDFAFMAGEDPDLVLRASTANMTFSRETANDRFYIRMYDGATPPNYSEFSTALFINLPLGRERIPVIMR